MRKHKIPFGDIGMYGTDISNEMNNLLDADLFQKYGIKVSDVAIADINLTEESMKRVSKIDDATIFSNPNMQSGLMANATAEAMQNAASNENGAMMGFWGMNMASQSGANVMATVNQNVTPATPNEPVVQSPNPGTLFTNGGENNLKFCPNCGKPVNGGNFCGNCGAKLN